MDCFVFPILENKHCKHAYSECLVSKETHLQHQQRGRKRGNERVGGREEEGVEEGN